MPEVIAIALRYLIIALVQSGILVAVEALLSPAIDAAKEGIKNKLGLSDNDALTYIANFFLDTLELAGLTFVLLKAKLPIKIADKLGFTTRGYVRGALPAKVSNGPDAPFSVASKVATEATLTADTIPSTVATTRGFSLSTVKDVVVTISGIVGLPVGVLYMVAQYIDYGNWNSGAYQSTFQKILAFVTGGLLTPDKQIPRSSVLSSDVWDKVYSTYREAGAFAIHDPYKFQDLIFSRQALIDLVDKVAANLLLETGKAGATQVLGATQALISFNAAGGTTTTGAPAGTQPTSSASAASTSTGAKVLTGIVSQGVLQEGLTFTPRPDDLIESVGELQAAAQNNLASWLAALPSRIVYEVKIVSTVTTKDGFTQHGTTQRIQNGTYSNGTPKYKTVTNKFAILLIYALTDKGSRSKLAQITLGPTNSGKLIVSQGDLDGLAGALPDLVTSTSLADVSNVTPPPAEDSSTASSSSGSGTYTVRLANGQSVQVTSSASQAAAETSLANYAKELNTSVVPSAGGSSGSGGASSPASSAGAGASGSPSAQNKPGANAATLTDWYRAQGLTLPPVSERALAYQGFGLGPSSYYTGTAEQNAKLLAALKSH